MSLNDDRGRRAWTLLAIVGIAGTSACGAATAQQGLGDDSAVWKSSRRLRAHLLDGGAGAKLFATWVDTKLGTNCEFAIAEDDQQRCLPSDELAGNGIWGYSDAGRTKPLTIASLRPAQPYFRLPATGPCDGSQGSAP